MVKEASAYSTAQEMAGRQRDISVSEFFLKNRHLLGFDSPSKALLTTVKEAVDNALDACEEAGVLPDIQVEVADEGDNIFTVVVEDNGPGILENQIARIFGKLLYGSRFHKLSQSRGQQGMGISAAGMYAQLTTGKSLHVISRVKGEPMASELFVSIDTAKNRPELHGKKKIQWDRPHGTRVEVEMEGRYPKGVHSVDMYLKQTAIASPYVSFHYKGPRGEKVTYTRSSTELPPRPTEIKPHPRGVELGRLIQMLNNSSSRTLLNFLENEFSRVGRKTAREIVKHAGRKLTERSLPKRIAHVQANALYRAIKKVPVSAPRTDCVVPIGEQRLYEGMRKEIDADFYIVRTRPPAVYRGNPFQVEVGIAYGRPGGADLEVDEGGRIHQAAHHRREASAALALTTDEPAHLLRFANRVPMLYEQGGCAITRAVLQTNWRSYGLKQPKGALPLAPMVVVVHLASVWVPFTSEAKEAIALYPEIIKELKLGLQACARRLAEHLHQESRLKREYEKRSHIEKYLPHVGIALQEILELSDEQRDRSVASLDAVLQQTRKLQ
ncbi:MAG: DNA topoisomerase VI subunit B [Thiogranum sp.]|jgi:DNA topoisomerase-6 subunit B|nr:DNA topoisomerase VI subunit B [Thiogranum sp.]